MGVVRAVSDANNTAAEFGILVRSDFQGKGLGVALMRKITAYCRSRGTGRLYGHARPTNRGMPALPAKLGFELDHATDDNVVIANLYLRGYPRRSIGIEDAGPEPADPEADW